MKNALRDVDRLPYILFPMRGMLMIEYVKKIQFHNKTNSRFLHIRVKNGGRAHPKIHQKILKKKITMYFMPIRTISDPETIHFQKISKFKPL